MFEQRKAAVNITLLAQITPVGLIFCLGERPMCGRCLLYQRLGWSTGMFIHSLNALHLQGVCCRSVLVALSSHVQDIIHHSLSFLPLMFQVHMHTSCPFSAHVLSFPPLPPSLPPLTPRVSLCASLFCVSLMPVWPVSWPSCCACPRCSVPCYCLLPCLKSWSCRSWCCLLWACGA